MKLSFWILVFFLIRLSLSFSTASPEWQTSLYMRAGNQDVIDSITGSGKISTYIYTFSTELPGTPNLIFGIGKYRGDDWLGQEFFSITEVNKNSTQFEVQIQIFGVTDVILLNVAYFAIDPTFPHHLNSFQNVPVNYQNGDLVNITEKALQTRTYTNTINYTEQAAAKTYKTFSQPLSNNKIILYMTSFQIEGTLRDTVTFQTYPITFEYGYTIETTQTYKFDVSLSTNTSIRKLHFSMLVFDQVDVESSNKYYLQFQIWNTTDMGGYYQIPLQFADNFIIGLKNFDTVDGKCGLDYQTVFVNGDPSTSYTNTVERYGGNRLYGVEILYSRMDSGRCGLKNMRNSVFYMKTWRCTAPYYYFDKDTNLCQDACGDYMYAKNEVLEYWCENCPHYSCLTCNSSQCLTCNQGHYRTLSNGLCECNSGYHQQGSSIRECGQCSSTIPNCNQCEINTNYDSGDVNSHQFICTLCQNGYFLDPYGQCQIQVTCDSSNNLFRNSTDNTCDPCQISNCITCSSLTQCDTCDNDNRQGYFLNSITKECVFCSVGCTTCNSQTDQKCTLCSTAQGFILKQNQGTCSCAETDYLDSSTNQCSPCNAKCLACTGPAATQCETCLTTDYRTIQNNQCLCITGYTEPVTGTLCQKVDLDACDYGYSKQFSQTGTCQAICGDGIRVDSEQCDDKNTFNRDGCSAKCQIETQYFQCTTVLLEQSICTFTGTIVVTSSQIIKNPFQNSLQIQCELTPNMEFLSAVIWKNGLQINGINAGVRNAYYKDSLIIILEYFEDLSGKQLTIAYDQSQISTNSVLLRNTAHRLLLTYQLSFNFQDKQLSIVTSNNVEPLYYQTQTYQNAFNTESFMNGFSYIVLVVVFCSFLTKTFIPIIFTLISVQTLFISLSSIATLHPILVSIFNLRFSMGYNKISLFNQQQEGSSRNLYYMEYNSNFLSNINIMLFIWYFTIISVLICKLINYLHYQSENTLKAYQISKRVSLILGLVNFSNLFFSICLMEFSEQNILINLLAVASIVVIIGQIAHFILKISEFSQSIKIFRSIEIKPVNASNTINSKQKNTKATLQSSNIVNSQYLNSSNMKDSTKVLNDMAESSSSSEEEQNKQINLKLYFIVYLVLKAITSICFAALILYQYIAICICFAIELFMLIVLIANCHIRNLKHKVLIILSQIFLITFLCFELSLQNQTIILNKPLVEGICWILIILAVITCAIFIIEFNIGIYVDYMYPLCSDSSNDGQSKQDSLPSNRNSHDERIPQSQKRAFKRIDQIIAKYQNNQVSSKRYSGKSNSSYNDNSKKDRSKDGSSLDLINLIDREKGIAISGNRNQNRNEEQQWENIDLEDLIEENNQIIRQQTGHIKQSTVIEDHASQNKNKIIKAPRENKKSLNIKINDNADELSEIYQ